MNQKWTTKEIQKSQSFIFPYLKIDSNDCITKTYMGSKYLGNTWGDKFIIEVNPLKDFTNYSNMLLSHEFFLQKEELDLHKHHYIFSIPEEIKETIVEPFLDGKYSELPEWYKDSGYYPKYHKDGSLNVNYQILNKDSALKSIWEYLIGVPLGDKEVWSRPEKEDEIYEYFQSQGPTVPPRTDNLG